MKLTIKGSKKYISWLTLHLHKEHPKTKGKTSLRR